MIFRIDGDKLREVDRSDFKNERELHALVAKNLDEIFGLEFVKSEVTIKEMRFDILAYDKQAQAFVIIELKNVANLSVIDQGMAYLSVLMDRKAEIAEIWYECKAQRLDKNKVKWDQSRVIFISPEYSAYQKRLPSFRELPMELWEVKSYGKDIVSFIQVEKPEGTRSLATLVTKSSFVEKASKELKVYTEEDHLNATKDDVKDAYYKIKENLLSNDFTVNVQKYYISFKKGRNIAYVHQFTKKTLWIIIMLPIAKGNELIKHHTIKEPSKGVQSFYNGPCFDVYMEDNKNIDEIVNTIKEAAKTR